MKPWRPVSNGIHQDEPACGVRGTWSRPFSPPFGSHMRFLTGHHLKSNFLALKKSLPHEVTGIFERELNKNQPGSKSLTASRSSLSSLMVASILDWLKASIGKPCTTSHLPFSVTRIGMEAMRPFSIP